MEAGEEITAERRLGNEAQNLRGMRKEAGPVEDQDKIRTEEEEVEAHRGHKHPKASDSEPKQEGEDEGDFELHRGHKHPK